FTPDWHAVGRQAMSSSRVALVSDDPRLATSIQTHLKKSLGQNVFQCSFDSIRNHLGQETDGLLLLATVSMKESEQILQLVREIYIRKLPPIIMIVAGEEASEAAGLDQYVAQSLRWPDDAAKLTQLLRERVGRVHDFLGTGGVETVEQVIARRL